MFYPELKCNYVLRGKSKHFEAIVKGFTKTLWRNTPLNLEQRTLLISILGEDLPDIKKQIEDNVVRWTRPGSHEAYVTEEEYS